MPIGRRQFLKGAVAAAASGLACSASLPGDGLKAERVEVVVPGLHPAHDGLRVAQLSDLHVGHLTPLELVRAAIDGANRFEPDLVVLTGDYLTHYYLIHRNTDPRLVAEQLGGFSAPTVAVLGNHDYYADAAGAARALGGLGYAVLRNQHTSLTLRGEPFTVIGVDDLSTRHADPARAVKGAARGSRLCLAHVPDTADLLRYLREPLLVLSGHLHGGQLNVLPFSRMIRRKSGLYQLDQVQLYVNRGVGNSWMPLRLNAPPEVTLMTLRAGPEGHT